MTREPPSAPVIALTSIGALIALLGFLAAGNLVIVLVGLGAIAVAGILDLLGRMMADAEPRSRRNQ